MARTSTGGPRLGRSASRRRCAPGVQTLESRQLLANFGFDPDGPGPLSPQSIDPSGLIGGFDFSVGNALAQGAVTAIQQKQADPTGPNPRFQVYYQATLAGFINPQGVTVGAPGLNGMPGGAVPFQITGLASVTQELTSYNPQTGVSMFQVAAQQAPGSFFRLYFNTGDTASQALPANNLTGTGFDAGTLILSGVPVATPDVDGLFVVNTVPGSNPPTPVTTAFDQFGTDNYPGQLSVVGNGATVVPVRVEMADPAWFPTAITNLSFNTTNTSPFYATNPSARFSDMVGSGYVPVVPNLGAVNGLSGPDFQTTADANASSLRSGLRVLKFVNGQVVSTPPGPSLAVGQPVVYTYTVTNTGETTLTTVTLSDDNGTPGTPGDDFTPTPILVGGFPQGDLNQNNRLDPGETWSFTAPTQAAVLGLVTNLVTASGTDPFGTTVSDTDTASYTGFQPLPAIQVVKFVNGQDANTPPGVILPVGAPVNYTYTVTNTGDQPLTKVTLVDDNGTPGSVGDDFVPTPILVGGFIQGDANQNGVLDPGESWNYQGPSKTATAGLTTNIVTASGTDPFGTTVSDTDPASYTGVVTRPAIQLVKLVNGQDANTPPGVSIPVGQPVDYTYRVTNIGDQPLTNVVLTDDNGSPGIPGDDFVPTPLLVGGFNSGDVNQNGVLDPGETWNYRGPSKTATAGLTTNIASVSGTDPFGATVTDTDPASYTGVTPRPAIQVVKFVNGQDANTPPGPDIPVGAPVFYTYTVTNTGDQPLANVSLVDDNGTPGSVGDDFVPTPILVGGFNQGDANANGVLDPGETWNYQGPSKLATLGLTTNIVTASGTDPFGTTVTDTDPASYTGVPITEPAIQVVKFVNGQDANTPPGPSIPVGAPVNYTYTVTNTGNVPLSNITLVDDNGTPGNPADDFAPTVILVGGFPQGDVNQNGVLDPGESWNYTGPSKTATFGLTTNIVTASGTTPTGSVVSDTDPASYTGVLVQPGIALVKLVNGQDANTPPGVSIPVGQPVNYTYRVTNTGNQPLSGITISDDNGTPGTSGDDFVPVPILVGGFNQGDANANGVLDPGETWYYSGPSKTATAGVTTNIATVRGTDPFGTTVTATDPASYNGVTIQAQVAKQVEAMRLVRVDSLIRMGYHQQRARIVLGFTAPLDPARAQNVANYSLWMPGRDGQFGTGDDQAVTLMSAVYDPALQTVTLLAARPLKLDGRYRIIVNCDPTTGLTGPDGQYVDGNGDGVPGGYFIREFGREAFRLNQNRVVQDPGGSGAQGPLVDVGNPVTFNYQVTNPGTLPFAVAGLVDDNGTPSDPGNDFTPTYVGGDTNGNGLVDPGEVWLYTAQRPAVAGQYLNTVTLTAQGSGGGGTVTDTATGSYFGLAPTVDSLQRYNYHNQPTLVVLSYNGPIDPATAGLLSQYQIVGPGRDGKLGTADDQLVPISRVSVDTTGNTVTLVPATKLNVHLQYRVNARNPYASGPAFSGVLDRGKSLATPFFRPVPPPTTRLAGRTARAR